MPDVRGQSTPGVQRTNVGKSNDWPQGKTHLPTQAQLGTDFYPDPPVAKGGGSEVSGQNLRGFVRGGADGSRGGTPKDTTVAADGTCRLKRL